MVLYANLVTSAVIVMDILFLLIQLTKLVFPFVEMAYLD
jgi:hypothetical protein